MSSVVRSVADNSLTTPPLCFAFYSDVYPAGKYSGKAYWGNGGKNRDDPSLFAALGPTAKGAVRPSPIPATTEAEAKAVAAAIGMAWGGTGGYKVKGIYAYKSGPHANKCWFGTGGNREQMLKRTGKAELFRPTCLPN